jgi:hypothetical protein
MVREFCCAFWHAEQNSICDVVQSIVPAEQDGRRQGAVAQWRCGYKAFGHPVASTLAAVVASGSTIWRTDRHGTITVAFQGGVPTIVAER